MAYQAGASGMAAEQKKWLMTHMMNHTILLYHAYVDDTRYLVDDRPPGRPEMEDIIVTC